MKATSRPACAPRLLAIAVVLALCLPLSACGLAESIAEGFVDDEFYFLEHRLDRSGTLVRTASGTDLQAFPGFLYAGDEPTGAQSLCVFGFPIDSSQQPGNTEIDRVTLRIWVEPDAGDVTDLGPLVVSHLPDHPDQVLSVGVVPHPPGNDVGTIAGPFTGGWVEIDVTAQFLQDWNAGDSITAFAVRFTSATDGNARADTVEFDGTDGDGQTATTYLVLRFSLAL